MTKIDKFLNNENELAIPYDIDPNDLSLIEQTLHNQILYDNLVGSSGRCASSDPHDIDDYKRKISSLLGGKTKGSTSGKENDNESPFFDSDGDVFYEAGKPHYMITDDGEVIQVPPELYLPLSQQLSTVDQNAVPNLYDGMIFNSKMIYDKDDKIHNKKQIYID